MYKIIQESLQKYLFLFSENLPKQYIINNKLMDRTKAIISLHFPNSHNEYIEARKRIVYEEALIFELKILKERYIENIKNKNKYNLKKIKIL